MESLIHSKMVPQADILGQAAYYLDVNHYSFPSDLEPLPPLPADFQGLNHRLDPGNVASIPAEVITDENGLASYKVIYPKSFAVWTDVELSAATIVSGSETKTRSGKSRFPGYAMKKVLRWNRSSIHLLANDKTFHLEKG